MALCQGIGVLVGPPFYSISRVSQHHLNLNIISPVPPKIVDAAVRAEPGSRGPCSATGTPPIYIALIRNFTVLINKTNTARSKLYQEGNYTCVATSKYGADVKHFVIKGGEKMGYFKTNVKHYAYWIATSN